MCVRFLEKVDGEPGQWLLDMSAVGTLMPSVGYTAGAKVHLEEIGGKLAVTGVTLTAPGYCDRLHSVEQSTAEEWEAAKQVVGFCATYTQLYTYHGDSHFPMDSVNVHTYRLPSTHLLRELLEPCLTHHMVLDDTVLNDSSKSPLHSKPWQPYNANAFSHTELRKLVALGADRHPFSARPCVPQVTQFGVAYEAYYNTLRVFVEKVLSTLRPEDMPAVRVWADGLHKDIPGGGFPEGSNVVVDRPVLVDAVTTLIWTVSVAHSLDHQSMWYQPRGWGIMRMRNKPPLGRRTNITSV